MSENDSTLSADDNIRRLLSTNPQYDDMKGNWILYQDSYTGRGGYEDGEYLWKGLRETDSIYKKRQKASTYLNLYRPAIDKYLGWLFQGSIDYEGASDKFLQWKDDANLKQALEKAVRNALIYGSAPIIVDSSANENDDSIYLVTYNPLSLFDWQEEYKDNGEATGKYEGAKIVIDQVVSDVTIGKHDKVKVVYLWDGENREQWLISGKTNVATENTNVDNNNTLGYAPMVNLNFTYGDDPTINVTPFDSLAQMCQRIYNWQSEQWAYSSKELINPMLTYPRGTADDFNYSTEDNVLFVPPHSSAKAEVLRGDTAPLDSYRAQINEDIEQTAYASGLRGPATYLYPQSGEAYKQQAVDTVAILQSMTQELQNTIIKIAAIWSDISGDDAGELKPKWPDPIIESSKFTLDDLTTLESTDAYQVSAEFQKELRSEYAKILSRNDTEKLKRIVSDFDNLPADSGQLPITGTGATPTENETLQ